MIYPWQKKQWQTVQQAWRSKRRPQALLLSGVEGLGQFAFAEALARTVLCAEPVWETAGCGRCQSCRRCDRQLHPDRLLLQCEDKAKVIKVDQVRQLTGQLTRTSHEGGYQVVMIHPADRLHTSAANALLKLLEEPPGHVLWILVAARPQVLPITVRSRCQHVIFTPAAKGEASEWLIQHGVPKDDCSGLLALSQGAPLTALQWHEQQGLKARQQLLTGLSQVLCGDSNPIELADHCQQSDVPLLDLWGSLLEDLIRIAVGAHHQVGFSCEQQALQPLASRATAAQWCQFHQQLLQAKSRLAQGSINVTLQWEALLLQWQSIGHGHTAER